MIIAVVGPTGVGKTKVSVELAKKYNAEIISCDSMQVYRKMDIGTAKATKEEMNYIPHYMIDIRNASDDYSVFDYQKDARKILDNLIRMEKNVIIVGGTGLYLKALLYDYEFKETDTNKVFSKYTNQELYDMVKNMNPNSRIHVNNRQRLESYLNNHDKDENEKHSEMIYNAKIVGLTRPREELYDMINKRVDKMLECGLIDEARYFYDNKITGKALDTAIAYKELFSYFDGNISYDDAVELIKQKSRNYAKRQYTWFNHQLNVKWFEPNVNEIEETINAITDYIET